MREWTSILFLFCEMKPELVYFSFVRVPTIESLTSLAIDQTQVIDAFLQTLQEDKDKWVR